MNWNDAGILAQRLFFCTVSASIAGSLLTVLTGFLTRIDKYRNSSLNILGIKTALVLYLVPISAVAVLCSRTHFSLNGILWDSVFWKVVTSPMKKLYLILFVIWVIGLGFALIFRVLQYLKLRNILLGNIPVDDSLVLSIFEEYKEEFDVRKVRLYQNDMIGFPIVTGFLTPMIILPVSVFDEKTIRMILEHEFCHILNRDLQWKKACLLATFIHWANPFVYNILKRLIMQEEVECDIRTCTRTIHFTMKEYGLYLAGLDNGEDDTVFLSALSKPNDDLYRRLEGMVRRKNYEKITAAVCCLLMMFVSVIPSYAATDAVADMNESWILETEQAVAEVEGSNELVEYTAVVGNDGVVEIDLSKENGAIPYGTGVTLDYTVKANTRVTYRWMDMSAGDCIMISANCSDSSIVYRIGIRDTAGNLRYVQGSGSISHIFDITTDGEYSAYVENRSSTAMQVTGSAYYAN